MAALAGAMLGVSPVSAATPGWTNSSAVPILDEVGPGKDAAFQITIINDGPGNIAALFMTADLAAAPTYTSDPRCDISGKLWCSFGSLNVGQQIELIIAYQVPNTTGTFDVTFLLKANGDTTADKGKNSRGDDHELPASVTVTTGGGDFDAGYNVADDTYSTNQNVGRRNVQATTLSSAPDLVPVTIEDGVESYPCDDGDDAWCAQLIGEWSVLNVNDGDGGPFKVTILIWGNAINGNPDPSTLFLVHTHDDGSSHVISDPCTFDDAGAVSNADCIESATKIGRNYQIVAWLEHNGAIRGGV
jgi:hypothetical protein